MNIPNYLFGSNEDNQYYNEDLNSTLREGLSNNGWTVPSISAADIALIQGQMPNGTLWYDNTNHVGVLKVNGTLFKFDLSAYP